MSLLKRKKLSVEERKERKKRILSRIARCRDVKPNVARQALALEEKPKIQAPDTRREIFALAVTGGDGARAWVYALLRGMTPSERKHLRQSLMWLDELLDQVALDLHLERSKSGSKTKGATNGNQ